MRPWEKVLRILLLLEILASGLPIQRPQKDLLAIDALKPRMLSIPVAA